MTYTDEQKAIIDSDSANVQVNLNFDGIFVTNDQIYSESMSLIESLYEGDEITIGKCNASCFKVRISSNVEGIYVGRNLQVSLDISNDEGTVEVPVGKYIVSSAEKSADRMWLDIVAYDYMTKFDIDISKFYNNRLFPSIEDERSIRLILELLCLEVGVMFDNNVKLINEDLIVGKTIEPTSLSGRDLLQSICEINGVFGHFNSNGILEFIKFNREDLLFPMETLYPSNNLFPKSGFFDAPNDIKTYKSCDYKDYETIKYDSVVIRMQDEDIGVTYKKDFFVENTYTIVGNPLTFGHDESTLTEIAENFFENIKNMYFQPCNTVVSKCLYVGLGDPYDIVVVQPTETEVLTTQLTSYVMRRELNGIQAISSTFISEGTRTQKPYITNLNSEYMALEGKYHNVVVDLDTFKSEVGEIKGGETLVSRINQNSREILLETERAQKTEDSLYSKISLTADQVVMEVSQKLNTWDLNGYTITIYDQGVPDRYKMYTNVINENDYYLDINSGKVYRVDNVAVSMYDWGKGYFIIGSTEVAQLQRIDLGNYSEIKVQLDSISQTVASSTKIYDEKDYDVKYHDYGDPITKRIEAEDVGDYYLDQTNGFLYISTATGISWDKVDELNLITKSLQTQLNLTNGLLESEVDERKDGYEELSTRISQTAKSISLSADKEGDKSASITIRLLDEDGRPLSEDDANIELDGLVSFRNLSNVNSETRINGGNIITGTLVVGENVLMGDDARISWNNVDNIPDDIAYESDIPTTSQITQITKNTVTTSYVNALNVKAGSVAAENITGTTISGKTISGGTVTGATISGGSYTSQNGNDSVNISKGVIKTNIMRLFQAATGLLPQLNAYSNSSLSSFLSGINFEKNKVTIDGNLYVGENGSKNVVGSNATFESIRCEDETTSSESPNCRFTTGSNPGMIRRTTGSSKRFKHDIVKELNEELDVNKLYDVGVYQYKFNDDYLSDDDIRYQEDVIGFIAEDIYENYKIAADYEILENGEVSVKDWNQRYMIPAMLKLIQNQKIQLDNQNEEIETLKEQVSFLMQKLGGNE